MLDRWDAGQCEARKNGILLVLFHHHSAKIHILLAHGSFLINHPQVCAAKSR